MKNRLNLTVKFIAVVIAIIIASIFALILAGAIGGVSIGVAPESTFGLVERFICPEGSHLEYLSIKRSYHEPGESEPFLKCVSENGTETDVLGKGIFAVILLFYIFAFFLAFIPCLFVALFVPDLLINWVKGKKIRINRGNKTSKEILLTSIFADKDKDGKPDIFQMKNHTKIYFNGREYNSIGEMPENVREKYNKIMSNINFNNLNKSNSTDISFKLTELKKLLDKGLITQEDYNRKKSEILSGM